MYNNNGLYSPGRQLYPWSQQTTAQSGLVYLHNYSQYLSHSQLTLKNELEKQVNTTSGKVRNTSGTGYKPDPKLPPYTGPYPVEQLQKARSSLIDSLLHDSSDIIQRVKPKIGIASCYGSAYEIIPPVLSSSSNSTVSAAQGSSVDTSTSFAAQPRARAVRHNLLTVPTATCSSNSGLSSVKDSRFASDEVNPLEVNLKRSTSTASLKRKAVDDISEVKSKKSSVEQSCEDAADAQIYKCDFCHFQCNTLNFVEHHLKEAKHFSASLYNTKRGKLISVVKKLAVRNKKGKNEALVVVCPGCYDIFEDIFMCGVHYKYTHGGESNSGFYSVCPVIYQETVVVYQSATCHVCKVVYDRQKNLHRHWDREPSHHPLSKALPSKAFALYSCLYCEKTFHTDFLCCKSHVLGHKDHNNKFRTHSALKVRHIMLPTRNDEVLPLSESLSQDGFADELAMLRNMRKHFSGMSGTKSKVKMIDERIQYLTQFRDAHLKHKTFTFDK